MIITLIGGSQIEYEKNQYDSVKVDSVFLVIEKEVSDTVVNKIVIRLIPISNISDIVFDESDKVTLGNL